MGLYIQIDGRNCRHIDITLLFSFSYVIGVMGGLHCSGVLLPGLMASFGEQVNYAVQSPGF
jgi:hypothetical protein